MNTRRQTARRRALLALSVGAVLLGAALLGWPWLQRGLRLPMSRAGCATSLRAADLERAIALGQRFMLAHQRAEGRFDYAYDWRSRRLSSDDNAVRQAGAAWGLALLARHRASPELAQALERSLGFFEAHSAVSASGGRHVVYPGDRAGASGTQALVILALVEVLGATPPDDDDGARARRQAQLEPLLQTLLQWRRGDGLWPASYRHADGTAGGGNSPYYDGEATLALARAGRVLARPELLALAAESARAGWEQHVVAPRRLNPDPDETKGTYQWLSMAMWELHAAGVDGAPLFAQRVLELADWMIDEHRTLDRRRNTGYAMEGIAHAADLARQLGDVERERWYRCVYDTAMRRLTTWQVGHPLAAALGSPELAADPRAQGGVQGDARDPELRIDTVQHQMHAAILGLRFGLVAAPGAP